ncbi:DUF427 domain-containing protein [Portibacter marinus]|uniref:DUF427 domain-containing protein n=1 Tax=Portibacter marinus TaxID=2898660 RepID=UPI001F2B9CF0|nr:DUF427 domain-containing protein [Portibacter marinus]
MKKQAVWNGQVIAESDDLVNIERNYYFPMSSLDKSFVTESSTTTQCPWKGTAHYYTLEVNGEKNKDAVWYYPNPKEAAKTIKDRVAFWKGVKIEDV